MKKLLLLFMLFGLVNISYAQENGFETISFGADFFRQENIPNPVVREVIGGTVIQVQYEGDEWEQNLDRKHAFEYACRILEEQMKTSLPLKVKVKFGKLRGQNVIAKTIAYTDTCRVYSVDKMLTTRSAMKWIMGNGRISDVDVTIDFFDFPDGQITFSNEDIFSYSMDYVKEDKYDFVTVALRELCKVMGFFFSVPADNINKVLDIAQDKLLLYDKRILYNKLDPAESYSYATSGNVQIQFGYSSYKERYNLYSPSVFENGGSLSYFKADEANNETKLMQPDLPRGTSIRYVGKWFRPFLEAMGWYSYTAVGPGGGGAGTVTSTTTDKVEEYGKVILFASSKKRNVDLQPSSYIMDQKCGNLLSYSEIDDYVKPFSIYPILNLRPEFPLLGWSISILCKDGKWDVVKKDDILLPKIEFSTSEIDPVKAQNYIRSSDGYLRCKLVRADWDNYGERPMPGIQTFARYFLLDYLPQKPEMAFSKVMPQTRSAGDEYYADVKIAFKNVEGTESILVEQLEEGAPVPFTYYVENVKDGYFIASVDKEYKTTFKLRAMNKNGETISEELIMAPLELAKSVLDYKISNDLISLDLKKGRKLIADDKLLSEYKIVDMNKSLVMKQGEISNNTIDIHSLNKGVYGLQVVDADGEIYSAKFIK